MGDETKVDAYKRLTLDLLAGSQQWMTYANIYLEHYEADGEVDEEALRLALNRLADEKRVEFSGWHSYDYRIASPQEGESLTEKVKRLEVENERLGRHAVTLEQERLALAADAQHALEERDRIRAEQAADRAAVRALVKVLPSAIGLIDPAAKFLSRMPWEAPLRELQARMATWVEAETPREPVGPAAFDCAEPAEGWAEYERKHRASCAGCRVCSEEPASDPMSAALRKIGAGVAEVEGLMRDTLTRAGVVPADDVQAGSRGLTFEEAARRYPEAFQRALDTVAARFDAADPKWHRLLDALKRRYPKDAPTAEARDVPHRCIGELGDFDNPISYADGPIGGPAPVGTAIPEPEWWVRSMNEGVDPEPDEPSVGDVDGYGRRG